MADLVPTQPAIHVVLLAGADPTLERFVGFGAEEVGVPTRRVTVEPSDPVAAAYAAARSSSFGIGLAIGPDRIALHESHMPPEKPVLVDALGAVALPLARRFGGNAARMVVRLPLRFADDDEAPVEATRAPKPVAPTPAAPIRDAETRDPTAAEVAAIVARVVARLQERGQPS